ncbi:Gti1/Pac2 family-domain-containing protein [Mycena vulgaris]|nr:Gti1/Pac2 family-domain-containing protein [Mycena vulgaris]
MNALRLVNAARQGVVPRITHRLNDAERRTMIKSGAVVVSSVEESGIQRWTDGLFRSQSRIVGNFLLSAEIGLSTMVKRHHVAEYHSGGARYQVQECVFTHCTEPTIPHKKGAARLAVQDRNCIRDGKSTRVLSAANVTTITGCWRPAIFTCASVTQALIAKFGDRLISVIWLVAEVLRRWVYLRFVRIKSAPSRVNLQHEDLKMPQVLQDASRDARHTLPSMRRDSRDPSTT